MQIPAKVEIIEVCPRDGFQNVKDFIKTENKIKIIKQLIDSGVKRLEVTSFVSPKWVPQMSDADAVVAEAKKYAKENNVKLIALAPNKKGVELALNSGVDEVSYVLSVSESHNKKNVNKTVEESLNQFAEIAQMKGTASLKLAIGTTFGCPFGEEIKTEKIITTAKRALDEGASEVILADTVGLGNPALVEKIIKDVTQEIDPRNISLHVHDTRGLGLANILTAMVNGIYRFESAAGGLGGCPFAPGASGNVATEDLINMLESMGVKTDIDIQKVKEAVSMIELYVNSPVTSHMSLLL